MFHVAQRVQNSTAAAVAVHPWQRPLLWGIIAEALMRFVPYIGSYVAAGVPIRSSQGLPSIPAGP